MSDIKGNYPESKDGNFKVIDTIGVPHPYCITPKHLEYSEGIYLDIPGAEKRGAVCDICRKAVRAGKQDKVLTYDEHEHALLVNCKIDIQPCPDELKDWLLSIKEEATTNGYAGFAFKRGS